MRSSLARTLRQAYREFSVLNPARHGAALAFYGAFALVPILAVSYHLTRTLLAERGLLRLADMQAQFAELLGPEAALAIQAQVAEATARTQNGSALVTVVGVVALLYTASGAFAQLKYSLNTIWGVPHEVQLRTGKMVVTRLLGMALVLCVGLLLVVAVVASVVLASLGGLLGLGSDVPVVNVVLSFILVTLLFTLLYRILPDARVTWRSAGRSAALAALAVAVGLALVNLYFRYVRLNTALSVAGGLAVVLIGMNYGAQIFLFGAVVSRRLDLRSEGAPPVPETEATPDR
jgi:membrane protein